MSHSPRVAILVLNWNRPDDTIECVQSLLQLQYDNAEIVVLDNASTDDSVARITTRFPHITLLQTGNNLGYAGGNNYGMDYALKHGADYVFVLNNDTTVEPDCVQYLIEAGESDPKIGAVGCFVYSYDQPHSFLYAGVNAVRNLDRPMMGSYVHDEVRDQLDAEQVMKVDTVHGCAFMIKREALEQAKGFDPKFFAVHEEVDLSMRLWEAGYTLVAVPRARIYHKEGMTFGQASPNRIYYDVRNKVHYFSNRAAAQGRRLPLQFWMRFALHGIGRSIKQFLKGDKAHAQAVFQGTRDGILRRQGPRPQRS
jgi:GT2 family glycosyltransferase